MRARRIVREALKVHQINDGDLLVFDESKAPLPWEDIQRIGGYLNNSGRGNCILITVRNMEGVHVFDENEMRKMGWIHESSVSTAS